MFTDLLRSDWFMLQQAYVVSDLKWCIGVLFMKNILVIRYIFVITATFSLRAKHTTLVDTKYTAFIISKQTLAEWVILSFLGLSKCLNLA